MLDNTITFTVFGIPQTKGSAKGFALPDKNRPGKYRTIITNDNPKNKSWAQTVSSMAQQYRTEACPFEGPIRLTLIFRMPIPKSIPKRRPSFMTKKPDVDKMVRSIKDALTGVLYEDDKQVVCLEAHKVYSHEPGVIVRVELIDLNYEGVVSYAYRPYESMPVTKQSPQKELAI